MNRRRRRKLLIIATLLVLLAALGGWYLSFRATKSLKLPIAGADSETVVPPEFLYSFGGEGRSPLMRPVDVLVDGDVVFVTDSKQGLVLRYSRQGRLLGSFGKTGADGKPLLKTPLYMAKHPKTGNIYVSDRRERAVQVFSTTGKHLGEFDPKMPKSALPDFDSKGDQWIPLALAFAPDGRLYVTDILTSHRLLVFDESGAFKRAVGHVGVVKSANAGQGVFQFPNGVEVRGDEVWVTDSNNRRIQVFDRDGEFRRFVVTQGLPRGLAFLPSKSATKSAESSRTPGRLVVVDTLAHDATIWNTDGEKLVSFGTMGVLEGQFRFPNGISATADDRIFIADTENSRIQVWGWPSAVLPVSAAVVRQFWPLCLSPLLLLPLLLLRRKRTFFATADFVTAMLEADDVDLMRAPRRRWVVTPDDYEELKDLVHANEPLSAWIEASEYSDSDVRSLIERLEVEHDAAVALAIAQRAFVTCTQRADVRRLARLLDVDVVDRDEFVARFGKTGAAKSR